METAAWLASAPSSASSSAVNGPSALFSTWMTPMVTPCGLRIGMQDLGPQVLAVVGDQVEGRSIRLHEQGDLLHDERQEAVEVERRGEGLADLLGQGQLLDLGARLRLERLDAAFIAGRGLRRRDALSVTHNDGASRYPPQDVTDLRILKVRDIIRSRARAARLQRRRRGVR